MKPRLTRLRETARSEPQPKALALNTPQIVGPWGVGSPQLKASFWAPERLCPTAYKIVGEQQLLQKEHIPARTSLNLQLTMNQIPL